MAWGPPIASSRSSVVGQAATSESASIAGRGFLDQITGEHHHPACARPGCHHHQIGRGVAAARVGDRDSAVPEVDDGAVDPVPRRAQGRDGPVDLGGVRAVAQRVGAKLVGLRRQVLGNLRGAVHVGLGEHGGTQDVIEVLVRKHDMRDRTARDPAGVGVDRSRFGERGSGVDQQRLRCGRPPARS